MRRKGTPGLPVDSGGNATIDPTENVKALTEAANLRQDDLRAASDKYNHAAIEHVKEILALTTSYKEKLTIAEAKRIDAIRSVDVNAVAIASEKASAAASLLANSVTSSAKSLEDQLKQYVDQINNRLSAVERSQYEGKGRGVGLKDFAGYIIAAIAILFYLLNYLKP